MVTENHEVLAKAEKFGDALLRVKEGMEPDEFLRLLVECNAAIRKNIKLDYGTVCAPAGGCNCGGSCC